MLEHFRTNTASIFSKVILGMIVLSFILYFGFSLGNRGRGGGGETSPVAKVNGQNIPLGLFNQAVQNQVNFYQQLLPGKMTPEMRKNIESEVLQGLIQEELMVQAAKQMDLNVTDQDLATAIRQNPNFIKDGQFQEALYLEQFKPYYQEQFGIDYEDNLRNKLLEENLEDIIKYSSVASTRQIQDYQRLAALEIQWVQASPTAENSESQPQDPAQAKTALEAWIQAKKAGLEATAPTLKEETLTKSAADLLVSWSQNQDSSALQCLLTTAPGTVCDKPVLLGDRWTAVQLLKRENKPEAKPSADSPIQVASSQQILAGLQNYLVKQAKIQVFLKK